MHDLETIEKLNAESAAGQKLREHVAGGGHAVAEYTGLHLTRWFAFADRESAEAFKASHEKQLTAGISLEVKYPKASAEAPAAEA